MLDPSETSGRPLVSNIQPSSEGNTIQPSTRPKRRRNSQSSDERVGGTKSSSRRHPVSRKEAFDPHTNSSHTKSSTMQRSANPTEMRQDVKYTKKNRISKAKKGLMVHHCECGRTYSRAEHLRRHQKNHNQDALICEFPECGKTFYRPDLLQRHQERHNEIRKDQSRRTSIYDQGSAAEPDAPVTAPATSMSTADIIAAVSQTIDNHSLFTPVSVSPMPEPTSNPSAMKQSRSYTTRQPSVAVAATSVDGLAGFSNGMNFTDPWSPSPNYSSSSGYASPGPGHDYTNMFVGHPFAQGPNRTRTSSNASFIEPWSSYPSTQSPTSATSTIPFPWTGAEKSPAHHALGLALNMPTTSYPMNSISMSAPANTMSDFMVYPSPKTMEQRDEEEQMLLFPEQPFGMGIDTDQFDQYLNNYWRLFHPSFPIIHRPTFGGINDSPMLKAAMIAIGAQYADNSSAKEKSRTLHEQCMKLLDQRAMGLTQPSRLCDFQSVFLLEVLSQYRVRRASPNLTKRFEEMYQNLSHDIKLLTSSSVDHLANISSASNDQTTYTRWCEWICLSSRQRLLLCSYILETQQSTLLARAPRASIIAHVPGFDLPFPSSAGLWEARSEIQWAMMLQQLPQPPAYVYEITPELSMTNQLQPLDVFQSSLLLATHYNYFHNPTPYLSIIPYPAINQLLDSSALTQYHLLTAQLLQHTPLRALLAVSGESWILSEKVSSIAAFAGYKTTLRTWLNELWSADTDSQGMKPVKAALKAAINLLHLAMTAQNQTLQLEPGAEMGLYYATLVLWAVTLASNTRYVQAQSQGQPLRHPQQRSPPQSRRSSQTQGQLQSQLHIKSLQTSAFPTGIPLGNSQPSKIPNSIHPTAIGLIPSNITSPAPLANTNSMLHSDITLTSLSFLRLASVEIDMIGILPHWPRDIPQWQQGVGALMRWVKMRLRSGNNEARDSVISVGSTSTNSGRGIEGLGELLNGVVSVLEKIMGRGWEGWSV